MLRCWSPGRQNVEVSDPPSFSLGRSDIRSRAAVRVTIDQFLDERLPDAYTKDIFAQKGQAVYQHVYESYYGEGRGVCALPVAA